MAASVSDWRNSSFSWIDMDQIEREGDSFSAKYNANRADRGLHIGDRFWYFLERRMAKHGSLIQCSLLAIFGLIVITVGGLIYSFVWEYDPEADPRPQEEVSSVAEGLWEAWTFMADGGTHAAKFLPEQRVVGAIITIAGIIYLGVVLAVIVDMVREKIDRMRRGTTKVFEKGHTLVVNWTDKTIPVVAELCSANESEGGGVVVVIAQEPLETMEADLMIQLPPSARLGTQIVLRSGSPVMVNELVKVSAERAKSIVILANAGGADEADSSTLRCVLSLKSMGLPLCGHIVAELRDIDNEPLLKLVGGKMVDSLVSHDVLGRLMLMAVRQPGLAKVYEAVLGFEGHEFYLKEWPELRGQKFGNLQDIFTQAVPLGIVTPEDQLILNPSHDHTVKEGDELLVLAEDDDTYAPEDPVVYESSEPPTMAPSRLMVEKVLICGWRRDIRDILLMLDSVMKSGSEVHMMTHCVPIAERSSTLLEEGLDVGTLVNIRLVHFAGNTSVRKRLEVLPIETYTSCMIFADQSYEQDTMHSDSHSLATLLLIRDIQSARYKRTERNPNLVHPTPMICEILDSRTQRTISGHKNLSLSSDFVQSNKLVAQIMAMVAENRNVKNVLAELLGISGSSLLVVPPHWYVQEGEEASFFEVAKRARTKGAILIGYQIRGTTDKTCLNPNNKEVPIMWDNFDLAVIAGTSSCKSLSGLEGYLGVGEDRRTALEFLSSEDTRDFDTPQTQEEHSVVPLFNTRSKLLREGQSKELDRSKSGSLESEATAEPTTASGGASPSSEAKVDAIMHGAMAKFRQVCASMPDAERLKFGEAMEFLGQAALDGTMFVDGRAAGSSSAASRSSQRNSAKRIPSSKPPTWT